MKELACNNHQKCSGNLFENDNTYFMPYSEKKNSSSSSNYLKDPEYENLLFKTASNLAFKNRHEYYCPSMNSYYSNHHHHHRHHHNHHHNHSKDIASSMDSNTSTINDYFKKQTFSSNTKSPVLPKQSLLAIPPKESENAKDNKSEVRSIDSRSSYVIEAVYPVQNFNTITVY